MFLVLLLTLADVVPPPGQAVEVWSPGKTAKLELVTSGKNVEVTARTAKGKFLWRRAVAPPATELKHVADDGKYGIGICTHQKGDEYLNDHLVIVTEGGEALVALPDMIDFNTLKLDAKTSTASILTLKGKRLHYRMPSGDAAK